MVWVLPGVEDVLANFLRSTNMLIRDDLPTLERPMKANSGRLVSGHFRQSVELVTNSADDIFTVKVLIEWQNTKDVNNVHFMQPRWLFNSKDFINLPLFGDSICQTIF
jgi:hypothetical protein